ncbi:MAG TPA: hypothetical protein PLC15_20815, partial [Candidatus Obscuribacter sp.]|nr:hypothetical protein [Candidatus Obscuribacter sp.]
QRRCLPEGDRLGSAVKAARANYKDKGKTERLDGGGRSAGKLKKQRRAAKSDSRSFDNQKMSEI